MVTFGFITPTTAVIGLVIALVIFGPGKLPELGRSLGKGINEFRTSSEKREEKDEKEEKEHIK